MRRRKRLDTVQVLEELADLLLEKKIIHYVEVARIFNISATKAWQYCKMLEAEYPENVAFVRGNLKLVKDFVPMPSPEELVRKLSEVEQAHYQLLTQIADNHVRHIIEYLDKNELDALRAEVLKLAELLRNYLKYKDQPSK
jgi:hypothetical protein